MKFIEPKTTFILQNEWICVNTPCIIISSIEEIIKIRPFNKNKIFIINKQLLDDNFIYLENDNEYVYTSYYPNEKINITEFNIKKINKQSVKKHFTDNCIKKIIDKIFQDAYTSKGNSFCINIKKYKDYDKTVRNKLERTGDPFFNRSQRHTPPIKKTFTRSDFENCLSFPAPIGIREEDFALPSEQNKIVIVLLQQLFSSENAPKCPEILRHKLNLEINYNSHKCDWCGKNMNFNQINQLYCSEKHSINFCHKVPENGTKSNNIYFGCGDCNRQQGGFSEIERVMQIARLVNHNNELKTLLLSLL
jgi:hypothetical protein